MRMFDLSTREELAKDLAKITDCLVLTHVNPDGDTIGSALSIWNSFKLAGKNCKVFSYGSDLPQQYDFLSGFSEIINFYSDKQVLTHIKEGTAIILVDCASYDRAGISTPPGDTKTLVIDHHLNGTNAEFISVIEPSISSAAELTYEILKLAGLPVDESVASSALVGIMTDTGLFKYPNTKPETMHTVMELMQKGAVISDVASKVYERMSFENRYLTGVALQRIKLEFGGKIAISVINSLDLEKTDARKSDLDFIIDEIKKLGGVEVYVLMKEYTPGTFRLSIRGRGKVNLERIASKFGGGGHHDAAGFDIEGDYETAYNKILEIFSGEF